MDAIYFTKIEFTEVVGYAKPISRMLLNLPLKELSYQEFKYSSDAPAKVIRNGENRY